MNRDRRRKVAKILRAFRKKSGKSVDQLAKELGWTPDTYMQAEQGDIALSEGQQNDVRRVMKAGIQSAAIRDQLRRRSPGRPRSLGGR